MFQKEKGATELTVDGIFEPTPTALGHNLPNVEVKSEFGENPNLRQINSRHSECSAHLFLIQGHFDYDYTIKRQFGIITAN